MQWGPQGWLLSGDGPHSHQGPVMPGHQWGHLSLCLDSASQAGSAQLDMSPSRVWGVWGSGAWTAWMCSYAMSLRLAGPVRGTWQVGGPASERVLGGSRPGAHVTSLLDDGTGGGKQVCGGSALPSLRPQPPPLTPHPNRPGPGPLLLHPGPRGHLGTVPDARQMGPPSGKRMQTGRICMSRWRLLNAPWFLEGEGGGAAGGPTRPLAGILSHSSREDQLKRNLQPQRRRHRVLLLDGQTATPWSEAIREMVPGSWGPSPDLLHCVTLGKPLRLSGPISSSVRWRKTAVTRRSTDQPKLHPTDQWSVRWPPVPVRTRVSRDRVWTREAR